VVFFVPAAFRADDFVFFADFLEDFFAAFFGATFADFFAFFAVAALATVFAPLLTEAGTRLATAFFAFFANGFHGSLGQRSGRCCQHVGHLIDDRLLFRRSRVVPIRCVAFGLFTL
jgi:hypothetical protein